jgi:alcohol dehydrogenase class IV
MAFNRPAAPQRFARIARALGEDVKNLSPEEGAKRAVAAVERLLDDLGIPRTYTAVGIDFSLTPKMVADVLPQFSTRCNPRKADADQIAALFNAPAG